MTGLVLEVIIQFLAAALGTVAFSIMFIVPRKHYPECGLIGGLGWILYWCLVEKLEISGMLGTFLAASLVVFLSRICGTRRKCPVTLFLFSGIFPLVPGVGIYWTIYSFVTGALADGSQYGRRTIATAVAIVLGIIFIFEIPQSTIVKIVRFTEKEKRIIP